jgi:hypothetical protein
MSKKIEVITYLKPWIGGKPRDHGWTGEVEDHLCEELVSAGFAKDITPKAAPKKVAKKADDADGE